RVASRASRLQRRPADRRQDRPGPFGLLGPRGAGGLVALSRTRLALGLTRRSPGLLGPTRRSRGLLGPTRRSPGRLGPTRRSPGRLGS
ncbi:MAG: hypothetical protein ACLQER_16460, partial [Streptosporangiaceae bacterium]